MSDAPKLFQLQVIDSDLDEKRRQLSLVEERLNDNTAIETARERLAAALDRARTLELRLKQTEGELEQRATKTAGLEKQLFGGKVGKEKQAAALERELQLLKEERRRIEDEVLSLMSEIEEQPDKLTAARSEAEQAEAARAEEEAVLRADQERLCEQIEKQEEARQRLAARIPAESIRVYEDLRRTLRGKAVAKVERNSCLACRVALPMGEVQQARINPRLSFCSFCGRILYIER